MLNQFQEDLNYDGEDCEVLLLLSWLVRKSGASPLLKPAYRNSSTTTLFCEVTV